MVSSRTIAIVGALAALPLLSVGAATGARAQGFYGGPRPVYVYEPEPMIPPRAVAYRLMDRGFSEVGRPRFDGRAYVIDATNPAGARVRLTIDARDGAVIGRERLGEPYYPSARPNRAPAGYGWTEEDGPRRYRDSERLVPPADIPDTAPLRARPVRPQDRAELQPPIPARPGAPEANALGMNPDAAPRRAARPAPAKSGDNKSGESRPGETRPAQARVAPAAPKAALAPVGDAAKSEPPAGSATAAVEPPKLSEPKASGRPVAPMTPASVQPPAEKAVAPKTADPTAEGAKGGWQDPPSGEARRNVRVIGGATVVPGGAGETSGANPN